MSTRSRVKAYACEVSTDTVAKIAECISPAIAPMILGPGLQYESEDFKTGIHLDTIEAWSEKLLVPLVALDPRGAYMAQQDLVAAIKRHVDTEQFEAAFKELCRKRNKTPKRLFGLFVFCFSISLCF